VATSVAPASQPSGGRLRADVVAGLTAAAIVIPKAMAYGTIAGLPVQVGLYTAFVPMLVYAFLGTSRVLSGRRPPSRSSSAPSSLPPAP
jgi:sulfate permease, SulP family